MIGERLALLARTVRGGRDDCWHFGACAVAAADGSLIAGVGDPELPAFLRSAAKPFQALPLVLAGGVERFELDEQDLALICASHRGTEAHVERVAALLDKGGLEAADLECGAHTPFDSVSAQRLRDAGRRPTNLHNNCSGKHAGMLLACAALGLPRDGYHLPGHELQRRCLEETASVCGVDPASVELASDGCSLPTYRMTIAAVARGFARLAGPTVENLGEERAAAAARIVAAMAAAPAMVAGPGSFTTRLIEVTGGRVIGKEGALGYYAVAVRGPAPLGVAVRVADGTEACRAPVVVAVLRQLGCLSAAECEELGAFEQVLTTNHRGWVVGEVVSDVELDSHEG